MTPTLLEKLMGIYRESAYNVQRTKAEHGQGMAYSRATALCDDIWKVLAEVAVNENQSAEITRFVNATYDNR